MNLNSFHLLFASNIWCSSFYRFTGAGGVHVVFSKEKKGDFDDKWVQMF